MTGAVSDGDSASSTWKHLGAAGFSADALDNYNNSSLRSRIKGEDPDLIILGCVRVGPEEQELIAQILHNKHHLLVLCAYLPEHIMRSLFLLGVDDVVDKPYHSTTSCCQVRRFS